MSNREEEKLEQFEKQFSRYAKSVLKSEMGRTLIKIPDLAKKLGLSHNTLSKRLSRGVFSAGFFFTVLHLLGTKEIQVPAEPKEDYDFTKEI